MAYIKERDERGGEGISHLKGNLDNGKVFGLMGRKDAT